MNTVGRRDDIDGLRAISVLAVIAYHFGASWLPGGFAGVDVFFVISGYLITKNIVDATARGGFSLWAFYFGRVRRILPALAVMIVTVVAVGPLVMLPPDLVDMGDSAASALFMVSNWYFYLNTGYFDQESELAPLLHTWSLGVEWQFYLAWPFIIGAGYRFGRLPLALFLVAFGSFFGNLLWIGQDTNFAFYSPFSRAWELALGALLVFIPTRSRPFLGWLGLVGIVSAFVILNDGVPFPGVAALWPSVAAALVVLAPTPALSWSPLRIIGGASYSLYLWHWPVLVYFGYVNAHRPTGPTEVIVALGVITVLSFASWQWIEMPLRRIRTGRAFTAVLASAALCGVLATVPLWYAYSGGLPWRYSEQELALINDVPHRGSVDADGRSCSSRPVYEACIIGDLSAKPTWALVGDSHAETLMSAVADEMRARGVSGFVFTLPGCPFIQGARRLDTGRACGPFVQEVFERLEAESIQHVIIQDRANAYMIGTPFDNGEGGVEPGGSIAVTVGEAVGEGRQEAVSRAIVDTIDTLLSRGIEVFYLMAPPEVGWNAPKKSLEALRSNKPAVTTSFDRYERRNLPLRETLSHISASNFIVVPSYEPFCDRATRRCVISDEHGMLYTDTDHLSIRGAKRVGELLFKTIDQQ